MCLALPWSMRAHDLSTVCGAEWKGHGLRNSTNAMPSPKVRRLLFIFGLQFQLRQSMPAQRNRHQLLVICGHSWLSTAQAAGGNNTSSSGDDASGSGGGGGRDGAWPRAAWFVRGLGRYAVSDSCLTHGNMCGLQQCEQSCRRLVPKA